MWWGDRLQTSSKPISPSVQTAKVLEWRRSEQRSQWEKGGESLCDEVVREGLFDVVIFKLKLEGCKRTGGDDSEQGVFCGVRNNICQHPENGRSLVLRRGDAEA